MRQKAQLLLDEAASWSLLWYLFGKGNLSLTSELFMLELISFTQPHIDVRTNTCNVIRL